MDPIGRSLAVVALLVSTLLSTVAASADMGTGELWARRFNGPASGDDYAYSAAVSPDGTTLYVSGSSQGSGGQPDYETIAYDTASGAKLWARRYNGPANSLDIATSLAVSPDGTRVYVTGESESEYESADYATVAYDAMTGTRAWVRRYDGPGFDYDSATSLAVSPDGTRVYVTGQSEGTDSGADYATVAYDGASGGTLWVRRYIGPHDFDYARSVAVSPDGATVHVTGRSDSPTSDGDYATVTYDAVNGTKVWVRRYNGPYGFDMATSVAVSPDGTRVYVTGQSAGANLEGDYATVAYDVASGGTVWVGRYDGSGDGYDIAHSVAVSLDGASVYVTGSSEGRGSAGDYVTVAHDAGNGQQAWVRRYDGPGGGHDAAHSVAIAPSGAAVYVTGASSGLGANEDYATIAYDPATGARVWVRRYIGPGDGADSAFSVTVSPDGTSVFVTGFSWGSGTGYDFATVAYAA